jgi:transcriptional regulator with XRE-family HTH domain
MNEFLIKFGNIIKEKRKAMGLSQEEFAYRAEIDRAYYSSIENGKHNLSLLQIKKIAEGLNIKIKDLFEEL